MSEERKKRKEAGKENRKQTIWFVVKNIVFPLLVMVGLLVFFIIAVKNGNETDRRNLEKIRQAGIREGIRESQAYAVRSGVAEYVIVDEYGATEFRWKNATKTSTE